MDNVLITGATGFRIKFYKRKFSPLQQYLCYNMAMYLQKNVIYCKLDLNNSQDLNHFIKQKQIDVIIHCFFDHTYNNIKMIKSISNAAIKNNIKKMF